MRCLQGRFIKFTLLVLFLLLLEISGNSLYDTICFIIQFQNFLLNWHDRADGGKVMRLHWKEYFKCVIHLAAWGLNNFFRGHLKNRMRWESKKREGKHLCPATKLSWWRKVLPWKQGHCCAEECKASLIWAFHTYFYMQSQLTRGLSFDTRSTVKKTIVTLWILISCLVYICNYSENYHWFNHIMYCIWTRLSVVWCCLAGIAYITICRSAFTCNIVSALKLQWEPHTGISTFCLYLV